MICQYKNCSNMATDKYHKYSQSKLAKKLYPLEIHHPDNIIFLCNDCHLNKSIPKWSEIEFCLHFQIKPRTKSGLQIWLKMGGLHG